MSTSYPIPASEDNRLRELSEYRLMDTPADEGFDRLTHLASCLFDVPIVLVTLLDRDRQFFKSKLGFDVCETSREISFCTHAIMQDDTMVIPDALQDPRFSTKPLVLGKPFIRFYAGKPLKTPSGENIGTVCLIDTQPRQGFTDIDSRNLSDLAALVMERMELRRLDFITSANQARFENIAATSPDAIICSNSEGGITFWNRSAERLFGYTADEVRDKTTDIIVPDSWRLFYDAELKRLKRGCKLMLADRTVELSGLRKDGSEFPAEFSLSTWKEGNTNSVGAIVRDITERKQNEQRLFRLASLDALTDLPNRGAWRECLDCTLAAEKPVTILLLDLDGFKEINDTLGHSAGDAVLRDVANRLKSTCEDAIMVARPGGDEFVALMSGNDEREASFIASQLITAITGLYEFAGQKAEIGVNIGVSLSPQHSTKPEELLGAADLALYRAKATGKGHYEVFEPKLREVAIARRAFQIELRNAFEHGELELYYQPQVSTHDERILGAEALLRWNHPERGILTPDSFIDVLGDKPAAGMIGEWILRSACQQAAEWRKIIPEFTIGVNLFKVQFLSARLPELIRKILNECQLQPAALELELVETTLLRTDAKTLKLMQDLRDIGIGLAFDDYGTGFASLSMLKKYPVTRLKIDRSFIRNVTASSEDAALIKAILYLARNFGIAVIAEGVENEAQLSFLKEHNCLEAQGYLFGRPVPVKDFILSP